MVAHEQLVDLRLHPFDGHDVEAIAHRADRFEDAPGWHDVELRHEPRGADHPQRIVGERDHRIRRCVQGARRQRLHPTVRIDELATGEPDRHGIDREVASAQIGLDVLAEGDRRLPVLLGVDLLAERRDLNERPILQRPHRAEPHAHEVPTVRPAVKHLRGLGRVSARSEVEIAPVPPQQQVADAPAHEVQLVAGVGEPGTELDRELGDVEGCAGRTIGHDGHEDSRGRARYRAVRARLAGVHLDIAEHADRSVGRAPDVPAPVGASRHRALRPHPERAHVADAASRSGGDDDRLRRRLGTPRRRQPSGSRAAPRTAVLRLGTAVHPRLPVVGDPVRLPAASHGARRTAGGRGDRRSGTGQNGIPAVWSLLNADLRSKTPASCRSKSCGLVAVRRASSTPTSPSFTRPTNAWSNDCIP